MQGDADFRFSPRPNRAAEIEWRPWGESAFTEARQLGRPIILSLSAVWCHWCHVMDETSYSDARVIARINEAFVPVRADNDRNPDVNRRYNMGGWPTTAFLAANGDIISGATYLPPGQMLQALERVHEFFEANRTALLALETTEHAHAADAEAAMAHLGGAPRVAAATEGVGDEPGLPGDIPAEIALEIVRSFDPLHGGLGTEQKFPQADAFAYLLAFAAVRREDERIPAARIRHIARTTLTNMATGELYDDVAGGFFRYSTRRDWSEPHYEKMLEDNARLAILYLDASEVAAGDDGGALGSASFYHDVAEGIVDYLLATLLRADAPCLGGSQDADETYYGLAADARAQLADPFVDPTVYVDWNALAASAFLRAATLLRRPDLTARALELLDYLWTHARRGEAMAHYLVAAGTAARAAEGQPEEQAAIPLVPGPGAPLLADQTAVTATLLDAYEVTGERIWLERALELAGWACQWLRAPDGRFLDRLALPGQSAGLLAHPVPALEENAVMAECFLRLAVYTDDGPHRARALDILAAWAAQYTKYGVAAGAYGSALLRYLERPDHLIVLGGRADPATRRLHAAALAAPQPLRTVQLLDPADPADAARIARADLGDTGGPGVYVCRGTSCLAPITSASVLARRLD
jgi:uncharacterized protein YyaL (SSP411 family)